MRHPPLPEAAPLPAPAVRPPRTHPQLLLSTRSGCIFHHPASRWRTPKAIYWLGVTCTRRTRHASVQEALLNALAVDLTLEGLNEASYAATTAGLAYSLVGTARGFVVSAAGFSHKAPALALRVCDALNRTLTSPVDEALFGLCLLYTSPSPRD